MTEEIVPDPLDESFALITLDDEEGVHIHTLWAQLGACAVLAAHGLLWRCEFYTRTRRAYLEIAYSRSHQRGKGNVYYRRHWAWLPSKPGTTTSLCTPPASASKADSEGAGGDEPPAEVAGGDGPLLDGVDTVES